MMVERSHLLTLGDPTKCRIADSAGLDRSARAETLRPCGPRDREEGEVGKGLGGGRGRKGRMSLACLVAVKSHTCEQESDVTAWGCRLPFLSVRRPAGPLPPLWLTCRNPGDVSPPSPPGDRAEAAAAALAVEAVGDPRRPLSFPRIPFPPGSRP